MHEVTIEEILDFFKDQLADVLAELDDIRYKHRTHGTAKSIHCRGPLCMKYKRDIQRKHNERAAELRGEEYTPYKRKYDRDDLLDAIIEWHKDQALTRRMEEWSA